MTVEFGGIEQLDNFYEVFSKNMRDLGTPVYGKNFLRIYLSPILNKQRYALSN